MSDNKAMIPQHEPLRVPQGWTDQARAFVMQLERIFNDIYKRFRNLTVKTEELDSSLTPIGTVKDGTFTTTTVASETNTTLCSLTLEKGVWIITGGFQWTTSFGQITIASFQTSQGVIPGAIVRDSVGSGGGFDLTTIVYTDNASLTVDFVGYQASGSSKEIKSTKFRAVRIK